MASKTGIYGEKNGNEIRPPWRWGIFRRKECSGELILDSPEVHASMLAIYRALKKIGFRETYWQYVYPGQIGGLIFNPRQGLIEHHVRFYRGGRIYVEMEFGRSVILHFLNRRMFSNNYLLAKLNRHISNEDSNYFRESVQNYKASTDIRWPEWNMKNRFYTRGVKRQVRFLTFLGDWRFLALLMIASFSVASGVQLHSPILPLVIALMIVTYLIAPRRN